MECRTQVRFDPGDHADRGIAASADGKRFVAVYGNGSLELHDTVSGALVSPFDQQVEVIGRDLGDTAAVGTRVPSRS